MITSKDMTDSETKKILIIEDEFPMRYLIEYQLKQNGYEVNLAKDGPTGLKEIEVNKPDLVLLDVMMPGMDGFDVCKAIKSNPESADIPVIFITASEIEEYRTRAYDVGAAEYMTKPFEPEELVNQITAAINRKNILYEDVNGINQETTPEEIDVPMANAAKIVSFFSPKGGVGTTTLTIQMAEAITAQTERPVVVIDLDLPFGGIAQTLDIFPQHDILELLSIHPDYITMSIIDEFAQQYRDNLFIIPAPGRLIDPDNRPNIDAFCTVLQVLADEGYDVLIDTGSHLTPFTKKVLIESNLIYLITSGQADSNRLADAFIKYSDEIGLEPRKIMPVINEINGSVHDITLMRVPVARIPFAGDPSENNIFLQEQGMRKMVSILH